MYWAHVHLWGYLLSPSYITQQGGMGKSRGTERLNQFGSVFPLNEYWDYGLKYSLWTDLRNVFFSFF